MMVMLMMKAMFRKTPRVTLGLCGEMMMMMMMVVMVVMIL